MRRRTFFVGTGLAVGAVAWVIIDADAGTREQLATVWDHVTHAFGAKDAPAPNWGDVAAKVGEFAEQERALREVLNPALDQAAGIPVEGSATPPAADTSPAAAAADAGPAPAATPAPAKASATP